LNKLRFLLKLTINLYLIAIFILPATSSLAINQEARSNFERRVNTPYLGTYPPDVFTPAIFWFGEVSPTINSTDVRVYYYDSHLSVVFHIIDRLLWFDPVQSASDLTKWDAVSLYLNMDGNNGTAPGRNAYLIQSQLDFQSVYLGDGATWASAPLSFIAETTWRGNYPNDDTNDKGWQVKFEIPFASLGLSGPPPQGTVWGLAAMVHDRDDEIGSSIPEQAWPETMDPNIPATWGQMRFGIPEYNPPVALPESVIEIRNGLNGLIVEDAHVGGHGNCGADLDHWSEWGNANYAGYSQINIQNQWDIADWPCFSKYFVTYPLDSVPRDQPIISATLTMFLTGNAGGGQWGEPTDSYIQVFTVDEDWDEGTITWNNAPLASQNITGTWVFPKETNEWVTYKWDVSLAVVDAIAANIPLRLALYSADGDYHSGKYFSSSDWDSIKGRPFLSVVLGESCDEPGVDCNFTYLPITLK